MRKFFCMMLLVFFPSLVHGQQGYLEVTAQGNRQLQLALAPAKNMGGAQKPELAKEINDVLQFDLTLAGPFKVMPATVAEGKNGIRPGEFDFAPWNSAGADLLIKSGYTVNGDNLTLECRLYDVVKAKELTAKRYSGKVKELRRMAHGFSDEVMLALTGERGPFTCKIAFVSTATGNKEIYIMDYDGYNVQKLTNNASINLDPDFSPNGREIIYTSYKKGNPDLYRKEIFSGAEARISSRYGLNITGAWSPDGGKIALTLSKDGNSEIYTIDKDGKRPARLTNTSSIEVAPAWSPDGSKIAFVSDRLGKPQVFSMNADGSNERRLTTSGAYNVSPRWSPKGDRILYCRQEGGGFQIHSIAPDGSNDTKLTSEGSNEHPRWSPDGRFVVFSSKRGGKEAVYVMRSDGTGQVRVSRGKGQESHPTWSPRW